MVNWDNKAHLFCEVPGVNKDGTDEQGPEMDKDTVATLERAGVEVEVEDDEEEFDSRVRALAEHLGVEPDEITVREYDESALTYGREEYLVLDDDEADEKAADYIEDSLWAFNADFILSNSRVEEWDDKIENALRQMQEKLCESASPLIKALLEDFDDFVREAISADGRGHFLSTYDGDEAEVCLDDEYWYIYRIN